ncbi:MAG: hypothetical protein ACFCUL_04000 [Flavobacteriaceae bacterium]
MRIIMLFFTAIVAASCLDQVKPLLDTSTFELKTTAQNYVAGEKIELLFEGNTTVKAPSLLIENVFGTNIINARKIENGLIFEIPENFGRKAGPVKWKLLKNDGAATDGSFEITPLISAEPTLETYFGPRSITAGVDDYSMLISIATDPYDNTLPDMTPVVFKSQFLNDIREYELPTKDFIAWKNIMTTKKAGRILVSNSLAGKNSKELTTIVFPAIAEPFTISTLRNHDYADGNQIIKMQTDIIRDQYGNVVSDGTLVNFLIKNSKGAFLSAVAPTIGGMATANMLHPSAKEEWQITAYITGAAKSNQVSISFETAISEFDVHFSKDNRLITVGPLRSFMQQLVPDGILLQMDIYTECMEFVETKKINTIKGIGIFELPIEYIDNGKYQLTLKAVGMTKNYVIELHGQ